MSYYLALDQVVHSDYTSQAQSKLRFDSDDRQCRIEIANTPQLRLKSFRLMYEVYSAQGYAKPNASKLWYSIHELLPTSVTLVVIHKNEVIGTATICPDSSMGIPADDVFINDLDNMRSTGKHIGEVFSLGIREDFRDSEVVLGKLMCAVHLVSRYLLKLSDLVVTVIPPHAAFYRYKLACQQVGPKGFHKKTGVKCVLLAHHLASVDHLNQDAKWRTLYRYYVPLGRKRFEIKNLREMIQPIDNCEISHFLRLRPEINELAALKNHAVNFEEGLPQ